MVAYITIIRSAVTGAALLALSGCAECPSDSGRTAKDFQVGRFQVLELTGTNETIEIDTAAGKTWRLEMHPGESGGGVSGWRPVDDLL